MKLIETKLHGWLDYLVAVLLIASPWLFDFSRGGSETWIFVILGIGTILYSLLTDYELGLSPQLTMRTHLVLDTINGLLLLSSPWLFDFEDYVWQPHLFIGLTELLVVFFSKQVPSAERKKQLYQSSGERWS
jgi:hypothetical protein